MSVSQSFRRGFLKTVELTKEQNLTVPYSAQEVSTWVFLKTVELTNEQNVTVPYSLF